jgi:hypothetical protein
MVFASPNEWDSTNQTPPFFQDYKTNFSTITVPNGLSSIDAHTLLGYVLALLDGSGQVLSTRKTINASDLTQAHKQITGANPIQGITGHIAFNEKNVDQDAIRSFLWSI